MAFCKLLSALPSLRFLGTAQLKYRRKGRKTHFLARKPKFFKPTTLRPRNLIANVLSCSKTIWSMKYKSKTIISEPGKNVFKCCEGTKENILKCSLGPSYPLGRPLYSLGRPLYPLGRPLDP